MLPIIRATNSRLEQIIALPRARQLAMRAFMRRGHLVDPVDAVDFNPVLAGVHGRRRHDRTAPR